ncbi:MAG: L,D-transpeptidase [Solirubrobacteraceae bacterium]|nr:L,D-transpeptidase [Solirubrobacteraceae bacterium]
MRPRRLVVVVAAAAMACAAAPAGAVAQAKPRPTQELAVLLEPHQVRPTPQTRSERPVTIPAWAPITGGATVLPVIGHATTRGGVRWLRVMLPGRPNGSTGWIAQRATRSTTTSWRIAIRTAARQVRVYRRGQLVRTVSAVVGKPSTPTPNGRFFVEESIAMPRGSAGAPYALATSARSNVLQRFEGGPGQIALHGVMNLGGVPGTAVSHGCVRLANSNIRWLAARISPGVPVTITR